MPAWANGHNSCMPRTILALALAVLAATASFPPWEPQKRRGFVSKRFRFVVDSYKPYRLFVEARVRVCDDSRGPLRAIVRRGVVGSDLAARVGRIFPRLREMASVRGSYVAGSWCVRSGRHERPRGRPRFQERARGGRRADAVALQDLTPTLRELYISDTTVKTHITHILQKLDLRDRVQAVLLAHETRVFDADVRPPATRDDHAAR